MLKLTATQNCLLSLGQTTDKKGNPAPIDDSTPPTWTTNNSDVLALSPSPDGKTCEVSAIGPLGSAQVNVNVDVDTTEGVKPGIGILDVEVVAGEAAVIAIEPGTPTEQP